MSKQKRLYDFFLTLKNNRKNVKYRDFVSLIKAFGFKYDRTNGDHNIYKHPNIPKIINIQNKKGEAKPYQIKQFLELTEKYNLNLKGVNDD